LTSDQLGDALARTDVVISSTSAPHTIVHRDQLEHALADRSGERRLVLIDLATPRDIDPAAASVNGIEIYTIDDLRPLVEQTLTQRSSERPAAYAIVRAEVARFTRWLSYRETAATLRSFGTDVELLPRREALLT
jgi:glutamyl-tRNA reductase